MLHKLWLTDSQFNILKELARNRLNQLNIELLNLYSKEDIEKCNEEMNLLEDLLNYN